MTRRIRNSKNPQTAPETETPSPAVEPFSDLPNDLKSLFPLLTELDNTVCRTRDEEAIRLKRLAEVRRRVFALQQGAQAPLIGANEFAQLKLDRETHLAKRNQRIAELRSELNQ